MKKKNFLCVYFCFCNAPVRQLLNLSFVLQYKKDDNEFVNEKEVNNGSTQQNNSLLGRLKEEMRKLHLEVGQFVISSTRTTGTHTQ